MNKATAPSPLRAALLTLRDYGYQPMYNGRPSCPFCEAFLDDGDTHEEYCLLVAALTAPSREAYRDVTTPSFTTPSFTTPSPAHAWCEGDRHSEARAGGNAIRHAAAKARLGPRSRRRGPAVDRMWSAMDRATSELLLSSMRGFDWDWPIVRGSAEEEPMP